ncbi:MAG: hypothetical protein MK105_04020 [Crocinitomicaceae bacterium]|nr:hypothetical protein [Crocinitomicaceae bacterium]
MKTLVFFIIILSQSCYSQLEEFNSASSKTDKRLMLGLGSWASANMIGGAIGWATAPNEEMKSFHQMNLMWNTVNLGLAIPGYIKAKRANNKLGISETLEEQRRKETIFLINGGLDIAYISSGLILKSEAKSNLEKRNLFNGYGNSLLIQGGFLLVFDWVAYSIHRKRSKNKLSPLLERIELSDNGLGFKLKLDSMQKVRADAL